MHFVFRILFVVFSMHLWLIKVLLLLPEQWNKLKTLKLYSLPSQFTSFSFFVLSIYMLPLSCFCLSYLPLYFIPQETLLLLLYTINIHLDLGPFLLLFISSCFSMLPSGIIFLLSKELPLVFPFLILAFLLKYDWAISQGPLSLVGPEF